MQFNKYTHTHTPGNSTNSPSLFPLRPISPCRAADAAPGRLNNASPRGGRQTVRGLPHGDSCGVNNKLQQLMLCSSKSMSTSLLSIRRSPSTRMGGPWGKYRRTSSRSYGRCGTSAVSCAWSGGTRMRSARIPLSTCEACDTRGTHVQVYIFFTVVQTGIRTEPQNHL